MNPAYSGTAKDLFFLFRCKQVQFNTGNFNLYPQVYRRFQIKTDFVMRRFRSGLLVQGLLTYKTCAFKRFPVNFYSEGKSKEGKWFSGIKDNRITCFAVKEIKEVKWGDSNQVIPNCTAVIA